MEREIKLTLIVDTDDEVTEEKVKRDIEKEISSADYYYEVISVELVR